MARRYHVDRFIRPSVPTPEPVLSAYDHVLITPDDRALLGKFREARITAHYAELLPRILDAVNVEVYQQPFVHKSTISLPLGNMIALWSANTGATTYDSYEPDGDAPQTVLTTDARVHPITMYGVHLLDRATGAHVARYRTRHSISDAVLIGNHCVVTAERRGCWLRDFRCPSKQHQLVTMEHVRDLKYDGRTHVAAATSKGVGLVDLRSAGSFMATRKIADCTGEVKFSPCGGKIAVLTKAGACILDTPSLRSPARIEARRTHTVFAHDVSWSPRGDKLVVSLTEREAPGHEHHYLTTYDVRTRRADGDTELESKGYWLSPYLGGVVALMPYSERLSIYDRFFAR